MLTEPDAIDVFPHFTTIPLLHHAQNLFEEKKIRFLCIYISIDEKAQVLIAHSVAVE